MKLLCISILLLCISQLARAQAADTAKKRRPGVIKNLGVEAGLMATVDAEAFYFNYSYWLGASYRLRPRLKLHLFAHYFSGRYSDPTFTGRLRISSLGLMPRFYLSRKAGPRFGSRGLYTNRGVYVGLGVCRQYREEQTEENTINLMESRQNFLPAYALGYQFPVKNIKQRNLGLALELFATGPYTDGDAQGRYTEIFTLVSLGAKLSF